MGLKISICLSFTLFIAGPLPAVEIIPFQTQNQSPLVQIYGLPFLGTSSVLPARKGDLGLVADLANNYVQDSNGREKVLLDGESTRITLAGRYGIGRGIEFGMEIPYVVWGGGFLDGFIDWYHQSFGFPEGGREQAPRNRLLIRYERDNIERLRMDSSSSGLGDLRLTGGVQLYRGEGKGALALRVSLKLPTGDSDHLLGSGSTDLALWAIGSADRRLAIGHGTLFGAAGVMAMTDGNVLVGQQRNWVGFGSIGAGWAPLSWLAFKIQANGHTPFYRDSELRELAISSVQLVMGGTLAFSEKMTLDIGISEDVIIYTSPDVVFHLALRRKF